MSYMNDDDILDEHDHKGRKVRDALKQVINTYKNKYSLDHIGHLIAVVDEEGHILAQHIKAEEYGKAVSHASSKFRSKAGVAWIGVLSIDFIAAVMDAHEGHK